MKQFKVCDIDNMTLFSFLIFLLISTSVHSSDFSIPTNKTESAVVQNQNASFDLFVPAKPNNGVSYNYFNKFDVDGRSLTIVNNGETAGLVRGRGKADVIIVESNDIRLRDSIKIIGSPADLLFISRNSNGKLNCDGCSFANVGRVTMAIANPSYSKTAKTVSKIGALNTIRSGTIEVKNLISPGLQSLELIADLILTEGVIDTNLRAEKHPESGMIIVDSGSKVVSAGGINLYAGEMTIDYADLKVSKAIVRDTVAVINGNFKAATIAISSPKSINIHRQTELNTISDAISTSQHLGKLYAPVEGIFIQSLGENRGNTQNINVDGKLFSDNKISIKGLHDVDLNSVITGGDVSVIAKNNLHHKGLSDVETADLSAKTFINNGKIKTTSLSIETENSIYNSFGGELKSKSMSLYSHNGSVINGSRSNVEVYPAIPKRLNVGGEDTLGAKHYGVFHDITERGSSRNNISAIILAGELTIVADTIENINPYYLTKSSSQDWSAGIRVNTHKANQVAIEAETKLQLKAYDYVVNSSAILGLHENGDFIVNAPIFSNERYNTVFESYPYRVVTYSYDENKKNQANYKTGIETKILSYSPPGRVFSFGQFQFSHGLTKGKSNSNTAENKDGYFFNEMSYFELFNDAHFFRGLVKSIGLELSRDYTSVDYDALTKCMAYRNCSREEITTYAEAETLFSVAGNIYGVKGQLESETDLTIGNINTYQADVQRVVKDIVNNYTVRNKAKLDKHFALFSYFKLAEEFYYEYQVHSAEIVGDNVQGVVKICTKWLHKPSWVDNTKWFQWSEELLELSCVDEPVYKFNENYQVILDKENEDKEVGDTEFTLKQILEASKVYVQKMDFSPYKKNKRITKKFYQEIDLSSVQIHLVEGSKNVEINYNQIDHYVTYYYGTHRSNEVQNLKKTVSLKVLMKYLPDQYISDIDKYRKPHLTDEMVRDMIDVYLRTVPAQTIRPGKNGNPREYLQTNGREATYISHKLGSYAVEVNYYKIRSEMRCANYVGCFWENKKIKETKTLTTGQLYFYGVKR